MPARVRQPGRRPGVPAPLSQFLRLLGGDVNGDFEGVPRSQLAVFPGTTHFFGLARTGMVLDAVTGFLDAPEPDGGQPPAG